MRMHIISLFSCTSIIFVYNFLLFKNMKTHIDSLLENYFKKITSILCEKLTDQTNGKNITCEKLTDQTNGKNITCEKVSTKTVCSRECGTTENVDFINVCKPHSDTLIVNTSKCKSCFKHDIPNINETMTVSETLGILHCENSTCALVFPRMDFL